MHNYRIFLLILFLLSTANVTAQSKSEKINDLINRYDEYDLFNGSVLVVEDGEVILKKGYGFANMEYDIPNEPKTVFRIGSITKQFVAAVIMQLEEEGKIKLDEKMTTYLPNYRKDTGDKVTIFHLLTHTSGIPSYTSIPKVWTDSLRLKYSLDYLIEKFCQGDLEFEPGKEYRYNNSGYVLLGKIVEVITGKTLADALKERIFDIAGMVNTGIDNERKIIKNRASGYESTFDGFRRTDFFNISNAFGAGAMYSTVEDLYLWDRILYTEEILSEESKEKMFTPYLSNYGFGWGILKFPMGEDTVTVVSHSGGLNGFNTRITRFIDDDHTIILLNNFSGAPLGEISKQISNILYDEKFEYPKKSIAKHLYEIIESSDIGTALSLYPMLKTEEGESFNFAEQELNSLGYHLLRNDRVDEAIEIFKLNIEAYPEAFNVYDSMGEAYMIAGNNELAIKNYKKSVELNPKNFGGIEKLKELGVEIEEPKQVKVPKQLLNSYVGKYKLAEGFYITITVEGDRIFEQATGQQKFEIFPETATKFYLKVVPAEIEFFINEKGKVHKLVLYQNGNEVPGEKVE
jgi:CubicO group peptidase (beta-lactamase class C family)